MKGEDDIINTLEYGIRLPIDYASFNIAAPLPGSDIREKALKEGILTFGQEGFDSLGHSEVLGTKKIDSERIKQLRKRALIKFYMRPFYLLRRLKRTSSLEHFLIQIFEMLALFKKS